MRMRCCVSASVHECVFVCVCAFNSKCDLHDMYLIDIKIIGWKGGLVERRYSSIEFEKCMTSQPFGTLAPAVCRTHLSNQSGREA